MRRSDFLYELPPHLIAQTPLPERTASRLLVLDGQSGDIEDRSFSDLPEFLLDGDLLVFNDTRVIPARLPGHKSTGGRIEALVERLVDDKHVLAHIRASKAPRPGSRLLFRESLSAEVVERRGELFLLRFDDPRSCLQLLETFGQVPLPPYITREPEAADRDRYQTVYAQRAGAVAAPTAGLHFDGPLLETLQEKGIELAWVTLHVGAGTFQPVREEDLTKHKMHAEYVEVSSATWTAVRQARDRGRRVVAVGTTSVRALETAAAHGGEAGFAGETDLFITPGYRFLAIDAMVTNFHLPGSTLLMLVSAFAGLQHVKAAYRHAVAAQYRFFSYGDAMFITRPYRGAAEETV